jgi:hypothetical protein
LQTESKFVTVIGISISVPTGPLKFDGRIKEAVCEYAVKQELISKNIKI